MLDGFCELVQDQNMQNALTQTQATLTEVEAQCWLVQYAIMGRHYSVGFSTPEAADKAVRKLADAGRVAVVVYRAAVIAKA